jgi:hypothetical protein
MSYISDKGQTLIDRRLYLPRSWTEDQNKRKKGAIPEASEFATKPQLAQQMLESAIDLLQIRFLPVCKGCKKEKNQDMNIQKRPDDELHNSPNSLT